MSRHRRNIEEEFRTIMPSGRRGIPSAQPITVGVTGSGGADSASSMSQASQEISQLEAQFKQQSTLIQANTQALQTNTTAHTGQSAGSSVASALGGIFGLTGQSVVGSIASTVSGASAQKEQSTGGSGGSAVGSVLSDALSFLSPVVSGILSLFGGSGSGSSQTALPFYTPPPSVQISDTLRTATPTAATMSGAANSGAAGSAGNAAGAAPQITVNVSAMDSQSFMDRSGDIASAVRQAMLNLHPINDVVATL